MENDMLFIMYSLFLQVVKEFNATCLYFDSKSKVYRVHYDQVFSLKKKNEETRGAYNLAFDVVQKELQRIVKSTMRTK